MSDTPEVTVDEEGNVFYGGQLIAKVRPGTNVVHHGMVVDVKPSQPADEKTSLLQRLNARWRKQQ